MIQLISLVKVLMRTRILSEPSEASRELCLVKSPIVKPDSRR